MSISNDRISCFACGACCVAFSISTLNKPSGEKCKNLTGEGLCGIYEKRPKVCSDFAPDEICVLISSLPFDQKVNVLQKIYGC
jgi:Fe-S-cluster containining protein